MFLILPSSDHNYFSINEIKILLNKIKEAMYDDSTKLRRYYNILLDILYCYSYIGLMSRRKNFVCIPLSKNELYEFWEYIKFYSNIRILNFNSLTEITNFLRKIRYKSTILPLGVFSTSLSIFIKEIFLLCLKKYIQKINVNVNMPFHSLFLLPFLPSPMMAFFNQRPIVLDMKIFDSPESNIHLYFLNNFYFTDFSDIHIIYDEKSFFKKLNFRFLDKNLNQKFTIYEITIPALIFVKFIIEKILNIINWEIKIDYNLEVIISKTKKFVTDILPLKYKEESFSTITGNNILETINNNLQSIQYNEDCINLPELIIDELIEKIKIITNRKFSLMNKIIIEQIPQLDNEFLLSVSITQKRDINYKIFIDKELSLPIKYILKSEMYFELLTEML
jgi:hypothetical protein